MPAGPIYNLAEVFADPHVASTGMVETIDHLDPRRAAATRLALET